MTQFYLQNLDKEFEFKYSNETTSIEYSPINNMKESIGQIRPNFDFEMYESGILIIHSETTNLELEFGRIVPLLMSLAFGRDITYDRAISNGKEISREMVKPSNLGLEIVHPMYFKDLLNDCLNYFHELSKSEKDIFRIGTHYLNHTSVGYIEDRILRTTQAWELTSDFFFHKVEISSELAQLKSKLLEIYREWLSKSSYVDNNGSLGSKISGVFQNQKLLLRMEKLVSENGLNTEKCNLDLMNLKNLRDQVAHTGRININSSEAVPILMNAVKGLQLIWLKRIGYKGKVTSSKNGWRTFVPISDYFD